LLGGNLGALRSLVGTAYWSSFEGAILLLEKVRLRQAELHGIDEALAHLRLLGVFDHLAGVVVGKVYGFPPDEHRQFDDVLLRHTVGQTFPILTRVDFGHTDPRLTLPLGVLASLDSAHDAFRLEAAAVT
jgi:muramoyltetrapeptide carboxypeptidase